MKKLETIATILILCVTIGAQKSASQSTNEFNPFSLTSQLAQSVKTFPSNEPRFVSPNTSSAFFLNPSQSLASSVAQAWVTRYNNGNLNGLEEVRGMVIDASGNVYVTGISMGSGTGMDYLTIKYRGTDGFELWRKRYNRDGVNKDDRPSAIALDGSGNVFVTGTSFLQDMTTDWVTIKYSTAGDFIWSKDYDGWDTDQRTWDDAAYAIAVDGSGNALVTGTRHTPDDHQDDIFTIKYAGADGRILWTAPYNRENYANEEAHAIVVDGAGNAYVTGRSRRDIPGYQWDYITVKHSAQNGAVIWAKPYDGPGKGLDEANAIALDGNGNVYVTGASYGSSDTGLDIATIKYNADGQEVWPDQASRYHPRGSGDDLGRGLAIDGSGNIYEVFVKSHLKNLEF